MQFQVASRHPWWPVLPRAENEVARSLGGESQVQRLSFKGGSRSPSSSPQLRRRLHLFPDSSSAPSTAPHVFYLGHLITPSSAWRAREVARPSPAETVVACPAPGEQARRILEALYSSSSIAACRSYSPPPRKPVVRVGRLTKNVTAAHLEEIFNCYGKILDVDLPINRRRECSLAFLQAGLPRLLTRARILLQSARTREQPGSPSPTVQQRKRQSRTWMPAKSTAPRSLSSPSCPRLLLVAASPPSVVAHRPVATIDPSVAVGAGVVRGAGLAASVARARPCRGRGRALLPVAAVGDARLRARALVRGQNLGVGASALVAVLEQDKGGLPLGAEMLPVDDRLQQGEDERMDPGEEGAGAGHQATLGRPRQLAPEPCPSRGEPGVHLGGGAAGDELVVG